jgi:hypothetical protein
VTGSSVIITWFTGSTTEADTCPFPLPAAAGTTLQIGLADLTTLTVLPRKLKTALESPAHWRPGGRVRAAGTGRGAASGGCGPPPTTVPPAV